MPSQVAEPRPDGPAPTTRVVVALGIAQTLAWGSSYYLPAIVAEPMARDVGLSTPTIFAMFSAALVVAAIVGPQAGRTIDRLGGRPVLVATDVVFAVGLVVLAVAPNAATLVAGWMLLGVGMGSGLYEAAFAALVRLYGHGSRGAITGVTLIAGFASTVGWPLSTVLVEHVGWRGACLGWAVLHLAVALPLNASLPAAPRAVDDEPRAHDAPRRAGADRASLLLSFVFAATLFASTAMATHLPRLLTAAGATLATAVFVGALVGPAQVVARIVEFTVLRRVDPVVPAKLATLLHPAGVVALAIFGTPAAIAFGVLHGAGNGLMTIAKGTLPLAIFGAAGYGRRQGVLMVPSRIAQASSPWLFGLLLDRLGAGALWVTAGLGVAAFGALMALRGPTVSPDRD